MCDDHALAVEGNADSPAGVGQNDGVSLLGAVVLILYHGSVKALQRFEGGTSMMPSLGKSSVNSDRT